MPVRSGCRCPPRRLPPPRAASSPLDLASFPTRRITREARGVFCPLSRPHRNHPGAHLGAFMAWRGAVRFARLGREPAWGTLDHGRFTMSMINDVEKELASSITKAHEALKRELTK